MLKFLVKVFMSLHLLKMFVCLFVCFPVTPINQFLIILGRCTLYTPVCLQMDQDDTLHAGRYWSEVLCCTIMTHLGDLEVKVTDLQKVDKSICHFSKLHRLQCIFMFTRNIILSLLVNIFS